jgi:hypothetical protein
MRGKNNSRPPVFPDERRIGKQGQKAGPREFSSTQVSVQGTDVNPTPGTELITLLC